MSKEKNKSSLVIVIFLLLLFLLGAVLVGKFVIGKEKDDDTQEEQIASNEGNNDDNDEGSSAIVVEQGEKITWESERKEFYIPKGWTYSIKDDLMLQEIDITGDGLQLQMKYLPVDNEYSWSEKSNIIYKNSASRLYLENGEYTVAFNLAMSITERDYETGETSEQDYALFMLILKDGKAISTLTLEEEATIKYILDEFAK